MSAIGDKIEETWRDVALFEVGKITWDQLLPAKRSPLLNTVADLADFAAEVYCRFRRIEAIAYVFRSGEDSTAHAFASDYCGWARTQRSLIERRLGELNGLEAKSRLEETGKFFIEEKLRWALGRLEAFTLWGY